MSSSYEPLKTVNGKPSYEAEILWDTYHYCKQKLANPQLDPAERQALEFYIEQIRNITPCANENKFRKPGLGIGGTGDSEIIKPYVVRDHQTNKPLLRHNGSLLTIKCRFHDVVRYMYTIRSQKAESLNMVDGVRALSITDQLQYQKPDPYAFAWKKVQKESLAK